MRIEDGDGAEEALNLAPMIDVVFLLLIFFMVATTFADREKELGLELPTAESGEEAEREPQEILLDLRADGTVVLEGTAIEAAALRTRLEAAARANPETPVTIRGDRKVHHEHVVGLMDACRLSGLVNLGIVATEARE